MSTLPIFKDPNVNFMLMQNNWTRSLNPLLAQPITSGVQLKNISLVSGNNTINTTLGDKYQGYIITGMRGAFVQVYEVPNQMPALQLVLNSSGSATVDIYVY